MARDYAKAAFDAANAASTSRKDARRGHHPDGKCLLQHGGWRWNPPSERWAVKTAQLYCGLAICLFAASGPCPVDFRLSKKNQENTNPTYTSLRCVKSPNRILTWPRSMCTMGRGCLLHRQAQATFQSFSKFYSKTRWWISVCIQLQSPHLQCQ